MKLTAQERYKLIQAVIKKETSVTQACLKALISRKTFYKWLKRYNDNFELGLEAFEDKKWNIANHPRKTPSHIEDKILNLAIKDPALSSHKIADILGIGNHGVHNVLKRNKLHQYESRVAFAKQEKLENEKEFQILQDNLPYNNNDKFVPSHSPAPPESGIAIFFKFFLLPLISSFVLSIFLISNFYLYIPKNISINGIGLILASASLFFGILLFLYSLRYYISILIVLSKSRTVFEDLQFYSSSKKGLWDKFASILFGIQIEIERELDADQESPRAIKNPGLFLDLNSVILTENPFVSIHLSSYNEKRVIDRLLTACTSFDYPEYEVIVADDSRDETVSLLEKWRNHPRVKISHRDSRQGYKGGALKEALKMTDKRAGFVLVFDADFIPYPDTITQFLKYFKLSTGGLGLSKESRIKNQELSKENQNKPLASSFLLHDSSIAAIQGYQWHVLNKSENWITRGVRSEYAGSYVIERSGAEIYSGLKQISGSVYMIRRDVLETIGWGTSLTEDFELTLKLYEKGYKVVYTPYIQAPAEAVSTIKRLIRQRMRWAEGHSFNIKKMFTRLLFGYWDAIPALQQESKPLASSFLLHDSKLKHWIPSPLTFSEKLELIYLAPYYLQAAFFIIGTLCWFMAEVIFQVRLPFWTEVWGWSLVATNLIALPLMNMIGLFMEETDEKDYLGLFSFIVLTYIVAPFQAYAAIKGFLEKEEGPWFRTPKTGRITDRFSNKKMFRLIFSIFQNPINIMSRQSPYTPLMDSYLQLATSNNQFNNFRIQKKHLGKFGKTFMVLTILFSILVNSLAFGVKPTEAWYGTYAYRKLITIDHTQVPNTDQSYFPVLVSLTDTALIYDANGANGHHVQTTQGYDIVFADTSDNLLPFERESYNNATGKIVMWVRITTLSHTTDNTFYIYYGKASDTEHAAPTTVWNDGGSNYFKAVWHMDENPAGSSPQLQDSTSNNLDATTANMESGDSTAAKIANGVYFNSGGTTDEVATFAYTDMGTINAFSYWLDWRDSGDGVVLGGGNGYYATYLDATNIYYSAFSGNYVSVAHGGLTSGTQYHIAIIRNGKSVSFYKNGSQIGTTQTLAANDSLAISGIANYTSGNLYPSEAILDEIHMSTTNRSADWIATEYNNETNQGTGTGKFIKTYSAEEAVPELMIVFLPLALAAPFIIKRLQKRKQARLSAITM